MEQLLTLLSDADKLPWVLSFIATVLTGIFYQVQKAKNEFDLKEMLRDPDSGNKVSLSRFGQFIALIISSWGFVYLVTHGQLTEMYFTVYMSVWSATTVLSKGIAAYKDKTSTKEVK